MKLSARKTCQIIANYSVCQLAHTHTPRYTHTHTKRARDVCSKVFFAQQLKPPPNRRKVENWAHFLDLLLFFLLFFSGFVALAKVSLGTQRKTSEQIAERNCRAVYKAYHFVSNFSACCTCQESLVGTRCGSPLSPFLFPGMKHTHTHTHVHSFS